MKAVLCTQYGPPEVLHLAEVDKPIPKDDEVLIRVRATAVNSADVRVRGLVVDGFMRIVMRIVLGFKKPRKPILGTVFSGEIVEVGSRVNSFKAGDAVFGSTGFAFGAYAEYLTVKQKGTLGKKPESASFEEAVALLFGGMTSLYFLEKAAISLLTGPKVLIYGATGSVGAAAVEIAKYHGSHVTAVCSTRGEGMAGDLGSDVVYCYDRDDLNRIQGPFDIVFDAVGKTSKKFWAKRMHPKGRFVTVGGLDVAKETKEQVRLLRELFDQGKLRAHIDRTYPLEEIIEAHRYVDTGRKKGNVIITLD